MQNKIKGNGKARWLKALTIGLLLTMLLDLCGFAARCEDISTRVLRLHILANSDSEADQALKLRVRDAVLEAADGLLDETLSLSVPSAGERTADAAGAALSAAEAEERLTARLPAILAAAQQCVYDNGSTDRVQAAFCTMPFTTRHYESVTLPAGTYRALRITIGEGAGHNWWCVVFPPMCLGGATAQQELADVLTEEETDIVTNPQRYEVRFKVVEWWSSLCQAFA